MKLPLVHSHARVARTVHVPTTEMAEAVDVIGTALGKGTYEVTKRRQGEVTFRIRPISYHRVDIGGRGWGAGDISRRNELRTVNVRWNDVADGTHVRVKVKSAWYETFSPLAHNGSASNDNGLIADTILSDLSDRENGVDADAARTIAVANRLAAAVTANPSGFIYTAPSPTSPYAGQIEVMAKGAAEGNAVTVMRYGQRSNIHTLREYSIDIFDNNRHAGYLTSSNADHYPFPEVRAAVEGVYAAVEQAMIASRPQAPKPTAPSADELSDRLGL